MGQTLTHGIYLPDEGERNCYNGLAANWSILDGAVGTIAEHTTQIAGKAPAVHTHTKADVTDLFNSANTWTGDNTFSKAVGFTKVNATTLYAQNSHVELGDSGLSGDSYNQISFWDKNGDNVGYLRQTYSADGTNVLNIFVRNKFLNGVPNTAGTVDYAYFGLTLNADKSKEGIIKASFRPYDNNTYDLGSSSYQWNNLYAKNYYYNGVAFTDKFVTTDTEQTITKSKTFNIDNNQVPDIYHNTSSGFSRYRTRGSSNFRNYDSYLRWSYTSYDNYIVLNRSVGVYGSTTEGETVDDIDTSFNLFKIHIGNKAFDLVDAVKATNDGTENSLKPITTSVTDLGTSTNKWKTLNGINPGALSLPDTLGTSGTENVNYFNVIGYLNNTGTPATIPSTATYDGWLYINAKDGADSYIIVDDSPSSFGTSVFGNNGLGAQSIGLLCLMCPIRKGHSYNVRIKSAGIVSARIYPAQGNV